MAMHTNAGEQPVLNTQEKTAGVDQRAFPRIKAAKKVEISVRSETHECQTFDIGRGGLCFISAKPIELGPATVRIANSNFVFAGNILASHNFGASQALHFHFQFDESINLSTLGVILGID